MVLDPEEHELTANQAKKVSHANSPMGGIFVKIEEAAKQGLFKLTVGGIELSPQQCERLRYLGYKVEGGRAIVISWGP